jgi:ADP-heptose:LPS heptosyltransferase
MPSTKNCLCLTRKTKVFATVFDWIHGFIKPFSFRRAPRWPPERILLSNWSSLGDVLLATAVVPALKARFPRCKIGFLVARGSQAVLQTCPDIDWIHVTDSWLKVGVKRWQKLWGLFRFIFTEKQRLIAELKERNYDCAFELYPIFPNTIPILWGAQIPQLIGFDSGGNSCLLSHAVSWSEGRYLPFVYAKLLEKVDVSPDKIKVVMQRAQTTKIGLNKPYFVFHPCASVSSKEFPAVFWQRLAHFCKARGMTVYFAARGEREAQVVQEIGVEAEYNLCNRLSWQDLVQVIQESAGIVTVDSVSAHLAAALDVPFAIVYKIYIPMWRPESEKGVVFGVDGPVKEEEVHAALANWIQNIRGARGH